MCADKREDGLGSLLIRGLLGVALLLLVSCGAGKAVLQPVLTEPVHTIELASLEVDNILMIRQLNPVFMIMGSSGMMLDAAVISQNHSLYKEGAGPVRQMCEDLFRQTLMQEITSMGYAVHASGKRYWDYFKPSQQALRAQTDGILRIQFKQVGFISKGLQSDYVPSAYVSAELIQPDTRKVLYSDRFSIGIDDSIVQMAAMSEGQINSFIVPGAHVSYENLKDLFAHPEESRNALLQIAMLAARHVAKGLRGKRSPVLIVYEPEMNHQAPDMPSFDVMRKTMQR